MKKIWALAFAGFVGACGTHLPELASDQQIPIDALVAKIDCEFQQALAHEIHHEGHDELKNWEGAYTITLKGNETGSLKATSNTFPFVLSKVTTLNLGVGGGVTSTANRTALLKFTLDFKDIKRAPLCARLQVPSGHPFFTGDIGIGEWLHRALYGSQHRVSSVTSVGHTFQFTIDTNANLAPSFVLGPAPTIGLNPVGTLDRLEDNSVDVVLAKKASVPESVAKVVTETSQAQLEEMEKILAILVQLRDEFAKRQVAIQNNAAAKFLRDNNVPFNHQHIQDFLKNEPSKVTPELRLEADRLATLQKAQDATSAKIAAQEQKLRDIKNNPTVKTTIVEQRRGVAVPAEQNPNIVNTQQLLTLERLNNTLRLNLQ